MEDEHKWKRTLMEDNLGTKSSEEENRTSELEDS